jgi:hypothetical protein
MARHFETPLVIPPVSPERKRINEELDLQRRAEGAQARLDFLASLDPRQRAELSFEDER